MSNRPTKKTTSRSKAYAGYTATEQDLLNFARWVLVISFIFLVVAAIITTSPKLMRFSIMVGLFIAYGVYKRWFDV